jgi:hypothetical protein
MKLKNYFIFCGLWVCYGYSTSQGAVGDPLIHRRMASGRNIVNFSAKNSSIQFYLKGVVYDVQERSDGLLITEWKIRRDRKKFKRNQFIADRKWAKGLMVHMFERGIMNDLFIEGRCAYRMVNKDDGAEEAFVGEDSSMEPHAEAEEVFSSGDGGPEGIAEGESERGETDPAMAGEDSSMEPHAEAEGVSSPVQGGGEGHSNSSRSWAVAGKVFAGVVGVGLLQTAINFFTK